MPKTSSKPKRKTRWKQAIGVSAISGALMFGGLDAAKSRIEIVAADKARAALEQEAKRERPMLETLKSRGYFPTRDEGIGVAYGLKPRQLSLLGQLKPETSRGLFSVYQTGNKKLTFRPSPVAYSYLKDVKNLTPQQLRQKYTGIVKQLTQETDKVSNQLKNTKEMDPRYKTREEFLKQIRTQDGVREKLNPREWQLSEKHREVRFHLENLKTELFRYSLFLDAGLPELGIRNFRESLPEEERKKLDRFLDSF